MSVRINYTAVIAIIIVMLVPANARGQQLPQRLTLGDQVPENLLVENVLNYPGGEFSLAEHKDKLVIIDFMATFCGSCIKHLSRLIPLQESIQGFTLLPVSPEPAERIGKLLDKKGWYIPFGVERSQYLFDLFPYTIISHLVWIKNNRVVAITDANAATEENILAVIEGREIELPFKNDQLTFDNSKPLLVNSNGGSGESLRFQSVFTGYIHGLPGTFRKNKDGILSVNTSAMELYKRILAYSSNKDYHFRFDNRISFEIQDSLRNILCNMIDLGQRFCYSLFVPEGTPKSKILDIAKDDLNRFFDLQFGVRASIQKREKECLALVNIGSVSVSTQGGESIYKQEDDGTYIFRNQPVETLVQTIAHHFKDLPTPVIDCSGLQNIDITLKDFDNLENLRKELNQYGLDLQKGVYEIDMLVLSPSN